MKEVLADLRERYEYIVIDAPPLTPVTDTVLLSTLVDGVVLVVDQQRARRYVVREAYSRLEYARAKVFGVVLNKVDPRTAGDAHYFHGYDA